MKRSAIRRKTPLKSTSQLKRTRVARGTARSTKDFPPAVRTEMERRSGGSCEAACNANCRKRGVHAHHRLMRSQGGLGTAANGLMVCQNCHTYIHEHPEEAYASGWLVKFWRETA